MTEQTQDPNRLREQRERSRLTVQEVSKILEVNHSTVTKWEIGSRKIPDHQVRALAKLYKVETHELFRLSNDIESAAQS